MTSYHPIKLTPLTPHMGAEVSGANLAELTADQTAEIRSAFLDWQVLVFRDQILTRDEHKAFARLFGELHVHPSKTHLGARGDREIFSIHTRPDSSYTNGEAWHTDVSCEALPPLASALYLRQPPGEAGGDTLFANMYLAFDSLSQPVKKLIGSLTAVHDGRKDLAAYNVTLKPGQTYPSARHPVVVTHPETGKRLLFVNRSFTDHIEGMSRKESDALLEMLWRHGENNPRFQCRVRWTPNTLTLWDNRCTWHHAVWDYYPNERHAERVSVCSSVAPTA